MSPPMPSPIPRSGEKRAQQNARILLVILKMPTMVPRICRYYRRREVVHAPFW